MGAEVEVLADSINDRGGRLTTFRVRMPRCNWAEVVTHRAFSRNASSSRAIPVKRLIQDVIDDPYIPERFGINKPGMQPGEYIDKNHKNYQGMVDWWLAARDKAVESAKVGVKLGLHKQVVNRALEPYQYINAVVSSTDWDNFLLLRTALDEKHNPQADLPIYNLAVDIRYQLVNHKPQQLDAGEWHIPFSGGDGWDDLTIEKKKQVAVARAARVSYVSHDMDNVLDKGIDSDLSLFHRLAAAKHLSPFEHVAEARQGRYGNYQGFRQLRWELESK